VYEHYYPMPDEQPDEQPGEQRDGQPDDRPLPAEGTRVVRSDP
jgi:hypothetical protein